MGMLVVMGAGLTCSLGQGGPAPLAVVGEGVTVGGLPLATVTDAAPLVNIPSLGMCVSPSNPEVNATLETLGVLTPQPCVPVVSGGWVPGTTSLLVGGVPAVTDASRCVCAWEGETQIVTAGQSSAETAG